MAPDPKIEYESFAQLTDLPEGQGQYLLVTVTISCPVCGVIQMQLPGHHLRAVRDLLTKFCDMYPAQTGKDDEIQVLTALIAAMKAPTKGVH